MNSANSRVFGEPVTTQTGEITAVFDPTGQQTQPLGPDVGLVVRVSGDPNPVIFVADSDVVSMKKNDPLEVRGVQYIGDTPEPIGNGWSRVALMRDTADGRSPGSTERWR